MSTATPMNDSARRKAAELLSTTGALTLGIGIGLILPADGGVAAWLIIAAGIASHGWGMYAKHRIEAQAVDQLPWWYRLLYWSCWAALAALAIYIAIQSVR